MIEYLDDCIVGGAYDCTPKLWRIEVTHPGFGTWEATITNDSIGFEAHAVAATRKGLLRRSKRRIKWEKRKNGSKEVLYA